MASINDTEEDAVPIAESSTISTDAECNVACKNSRRSFPSEKKFVEEHFDQLPSELKVGYYDVVILYHENDHIRADEFKQTLCNIELKNGTKLKAVLHDDPAFMSLSGAEFENLEQVFERCTFAFVFLSDAFVQDKWCKIVSQSFMMEMIYEEKKTWSVIPVLTSPRKKLKFKIPTGLNALRELKFYPPMNLFMNCVKTLVSDKYNVRAEKEKSLLSRRFSFLSKLPKFGGDSKKSVTITSAPVNNVTRGKSCNNETLTEKFKMSNLYDNTQTSVATDLETDGIQTKCCKSTPLQLVDGNLTCPSNFLKKVDDKDLIRNNRLVSKASHSVGIIRGPFSLGTGFRVGTKYLATARHVVMENAGTNGKIDDVKLRSQRFFVEFEYMCNNQQHDIANIFYFRNVLYDNADFDTVMLELAEENEKPFPPPISLISKINTNSPVYIIGHPNGLPQMVDPKLSLYKYNKDDVDKSRAWAASKGITAEDYIDIENKNKVLFHCASQHGASGALGVMIDQSFDEPQSVFMLLKGFPNFFYGNESFTESDKDNFLIVEQGVLLMSVYEDMQRQPKYDDFVNDIISTLQNLKDD